MTVTLPSMDRVMSYAVEKQVYDGVGDTFPLVAVASTMEPEVRKRFLVAVAAAVALVTLREWTQAVKEGRVTSVLKQVLRSLNHQLSDRFHEALRKGYMRGATFAAKQLATPTDLIRIDQVAPFASAWARSHAPQLADEMVEGGVEQVQRLIQESVEQRMPAQTLAKRIRSQIGLTSRDASAVRRFIRELQADPTVSAARVEQRAARKAEAFLRRRADTIARTEMMRAHNMGQHGVWQQAVHQGILSPATKRQYLVIWDEILCPWCESMAGATADLNGTTWSIGGTVVRTGFSGPPAHPLCRCTVSLVRTS